MAIDLSIVVCVEETDINYLLQFFQSLETHFKNAEIIVCNNSKGKPVENFLKGLPNIKLHTVLVDSRLDYLYTFGLEKTTHKYILFFPHCRFHFYTGLSKEMRIRMAGHEYILASIIGVNFRKSQVLLVSRPVFQKKAFLLKDPNFVDTFLSSSSHITLESDWYDYLQPHAKQLEITSPAEQQRIEIESPKPPVRSITERIQHVPKRIKPEQVSLARKTHVEVRANLVERLDHINIFVLSYERPTITEKCVESFIKYISLPKKIFICDNNSSESTKQRLSKLQEKYPEIIKCYFNTSNRWIQGFNQAVNENLTDFFVITDNDIFLQEYNTDIINHMYNLLKKYSLGAIGLNIFGSNKVHGQEPTNNEMIYTTLLDSTFQLMRKDVYKGFNGYVNFKKNHMGVRKFRTGWTCSPYYADHMWNDKEFHAMENDPEYLFYAQEKAIHLERETYTSYGHIKEKLKELSLKKKILVQFPTRSRVDKVFSVLDQYYQKAVDLDNIYFNISFDTDDLSMNNRKVIEKIYTYKNCDYTVRNNRTKINAINNIPDIDWDICLQISDDMICQVSDWDEIIRQDFEKTFPDLDGTLWYNDGFQPRINTLICIGRKYYERYKYLYNPEYKSLWSDNEYTDVAKSQNKMTYFKKVIIQHNHPTNCKVSSDNLYAHNDKFYSIDQNTYNLRRVKKFKDDLLLSILICTTPSRKSQFDWLLNYLENISVGYRNYIEILSDNSMDITVGTKRNRLLEKVRGKYFCFLDDDDSLVEDYFPLIFDGLLSNKDCISLQGIITENGKNPKIFIHSLNNKTYFESGGIYYRPPNHLNIIKTDIGKKFKFPDKNFSEDTDWAMQICKSSVLKSEYLVTESYYNYYYINK